MTTYKVIDHGFVECSDVKVEHPVHQGSFDGIFWIDSIVLAEFVHQVSHYGSTENVYG